MRLGVKISQDLCAQIRDKLTMKTSNLIHEKISRKIGSERQRWSYCAFEKKDRITVILLLVRFVCMTQHRADGVYGHHASCSITLNHAQLRSTTLNYAQPRSITLNHAQSRSITTLHPQHQQSELRGYNSEQYYLVVAVKHFRTLGQWLNLVYMPLHSYIQLPFFVPDMAGAFPLGALTVVSCLEATIIHSNAHSPVYQWNPILRNSTVQLR